MVNLVHPIDFGLLNLKYFSNSNSNCLQIAAPAPTSLKKDKLRNTVGQNSFYSKK